MDTGASSVTKAGVLVLIASAFSLGLDFAFRLLLAQFLSAETFGIIFLSISIINICTIVVVMGLNQGVTKYIAEGELSEGSIVGTAVLAIGLASTAPILIAVIQSDFLISQFYNGGTDQMAILLFAAIIPFYALNQLIEGILRGRGETETYVLFRRVFFPLSLLGFGFAGTYVVGTVMGIAGGLLVAYLSTTLFGVYCLSRVNVSVAVPTTESRAVITFSLPLVLSASTYTLLMYFDRIALGWFSVPETVGQYEVAVTIALLVGIFQSAFNFLILPDLSKKASSDDLAGFQQTYSHTTKWTVIFTAPAVALLLVRPSFFIDLFGDSFDSSTIVLPLAILCIGFFLDTATGPNGDALLGFGKSRHVMVYNVIAVIGNVGLNIVLVPLYGVGGAAVATAVSFTIMNGLKIADLHFNHGITPPKSVFKYTILWLAFPAAVLLMLPNSVHLVVEFALLSAVSLVSIGFSVLTLSVTNNITKEDRALLASIVPFSSTVRLLVNR